MLSKADLHIHTRFSIDCFSPISFIVKTAIRKGLKVIAITDHDEIKGAKAAKKYVKKHKLPLEIIVGEEISSKGGHVIGLFLKRRIRPHQPLDWTIKEIKKQGGLVIIPHLSFDEELKKDGIYRYKVNYQRLVKNKKLLKMVDAVETGNYSMFDPSYEAQAKYINEKFLRKTGVANSDSHSSKHVGNFYNIFEGKTAKDLRNSIVSNKITTQAKTSFNFVNKIEHNKGTIKIPFFFVIGNTLKALGWAPKKATKKIIDLRMKTYEP